MPIFTFAKAKYDESDERYELYGRDDDPFRYPRMVYNAVIAGKSRFGWGNWEVDAASPVLRRIKPGHWIVHVNTPDYGHCVAAKVLHGVAQDAGLEVAWGHDFQHYFDVDPTSVVEFERRDADRFDNCLYWPLRPRRKAQQMNPAIENDFFRFLDTIDRKR